MISLYYLFGEDDDPFTLGTTIFPICVLPIEPAPGDFVHSLRLFHPHLGDGAQNQIYPFGVNVIAEHETPLSVMGPNGKVAPVIDLT